MNNNKYISLRLKQTTMQLKLESRCKGANTKFAVPWNHWEKEENENKQTTFYFFGASVLASSSTLQQGPQ